MTGADVVLADLTEARQALDALIADKAMLEAVAAAGHLIAQSQKAGGTVMLVVKGAFDMRPPEGLVFIPIGPPRTSEQILVHSRNVALSSAAEAFWAHAARSAGRDDSAD